MAQIGEAAKPGRREQVATRIAFFVVGLCFASLAPIIPFIKSGIGLNDGQLGGLLLCTGLGSVVTMPFSGAAASRFGCRLALVTAGTVGGLCLPVIASATSAPVLAISLALFGAGLGTFDAVMNMQAVMVERASGRAMMSGFHGLFSAGGIVGAGLMTRLLSLGLTPLTSILVVVSLSACMLIASVRGLLPYGSEEGAFTFALPRGRVLLIGAFCFVMFLSEGSVLDWSAVLLNTVRGLEKSQAGIGYLAFSLTMTAGRLSGDKIVHRLGPWPVVLFGALLAASGFTLAACAPTWQLSALGFALVGAGASNVVPVLFSAAGRQKAMPSSSAIAAVTTMGYLGILLGPGLIGLIARACSLPVALMVLASGLMLVALFSKRATQPANP